MSSVVVDIVIPTRNRAALTLQAIRSVQEQTMSDWKLFVVDDASDDETSLRQIHEGIADDLRITIVERATQGGPAAARQTGLLSGTAPYVAILDSDDLWEPMKLVRQVEVLDRWTRIRPEITGCFSLHTWPHYSAKRIRRLQGEAGAEKLVHNPLCSSNMSSPLILRTSLEGAGGFLAGDGTQLRTAEGIEFFIRLTSLGPLVRQGDILVTCRTHGGSRASDEMSNLVGAQELAAVIDLHADWLSRWPDDLASLRARAGARYLDACHSREGYAYLRRAWMSAPWTTKATLMSAYGPFVVKKSTRRIADQIVGWVRR